MEFTHYYGRHKQKNSVVVQPAVVQTTGKKYQFRADVELTKDIENFKKEMDQGDTKVISDILNDFFLTKKLREQKEDVEYFIKFANKKSA